MARGKPDSAQQGPPVLLGDPDVVVAQIDTLLERGSGLLRTTTLPSPADLEGFRLQFSGWRDLTIEHLRRWFDTEEYADKFGTATRASGLITIPQTDAEVFSRLHRQTRNGVAKLELVREVVTAVLPSAPERPSAPGSGSPQSVRVDHLEIHNSPIGNMNLGTVVGDIKAKAKTVTGPGADKFQEAVESLATAVEADDGLDGEQTGDALDQIRFLTEAAQPGAARNRGALRGVLIGLKSVLGLSASAHSAWQDWGPTIEEFLHHLQ